MAFNPFDIDLPVKDIIAEVQQTLTTENTVIISAPPGAGKSTLLPLALLDAPWLAGKKIMMLEPRRLATKSIAMRMADLLGEKAGETIGYRIRFETRVSDKTKLEVVTEGILTRMLHSDNALEDVGLIIFDEFHERSIHADVALALARESQGVLRPDLRLMVMSATLNMPVLSEMLKAPVIESLGRQYPVDVFYTQEQDIRLLPELASSVIRKAVKDHDGDVLVFLPGQGEIKKCETLLKSALPNFSVLPLYGQLPPNKQRLAISPDKNGRRKIVLSTSIAETSLTIEGIKIVVDSGFGRTSKFDPNSGLSRLETIQVTQDSADQRAGRAGRLSAGVCYRMWSKATQNIMGKHRVPEIMEADLASLVLDMAEWGISDINTLNWLSPPPTGALGQATELLHELGALENNKITRHGKRVHDVPCHPRIAHMLLEAEDEEQIELATDLASVLEERDPLPRGAGIDINLRVEALRRHRSTNSQNRQFNNIEKVASSYRNMFDVEEDNSPFDPFASGVLLAYAFPERIASARSGNNAQFQMANGRIASASHKDDLAFEAWLAIANVNARDGMGTIFLAAPLNPRDLAPMVKEKEIITWDTRLGGLIATKDLRIGNIVLKSTPLPDPDESHLTKAICHAIKKEGERLLDFNNEAFIQWQNRVMSLRKWNPDENWPDVSIPNLLSTSETWLSPYLTGIKKPEDLKKLNLKQILHSSLDWEIQEKLNKLAPEKIDVPSGSSIKLVYQYDGSAPILSVRLQEVFGLSSTPTVNNGNNTALMHLLSPGYKPVQVTSDLESFWNNTYYEVKKELKRRYPKHAWPEDPWTEEAVRGVRRKK